MRAYLLGTLVGQEARAIEDRYFGDRAFFLWVQAVEEGLIEDYLDGKLSAVNVQRFESRYLNVADLRRKLDEVRERHRPISTREPMRVKMFFPITALALVCICGISLLLYIHRTKESHLQMAQAKPDMISVVLSPGITQGAGSTMTRVQLPAKAVGIQFLIELPGRVAPVQCLVQLSEIEADGHLSNIWNSQAVIPSKPTGTGQQVAFQLDSSKLHRGDFAVELRMTDGAVLGSYIFRVIVPTPARLDLRLPRGLDWRSGTFV